MKNRIFLILFIFIIISCTTIVAIKEYAPILRVVPNNTNYSFYVPDSDNLGWNIPGNNQGEDTVTIENTVYLEDGSLAYIESINYKIYSNNNLILNDNVNYIMPILIEENDTIQLDELYIIIDEGDAYEIDVADGEEDFQGSGFIEITINYYDNINNNYSTIPIRYEFTVAKP